MKTLTWTGSRGNAIELRAECKIEMAETEINLDGHVFDGKKEPTIRANLELYVDGKKVDSCWNTNFWRIIKFDDNGLKKVWGLKLTMTAEQAVLVEKFLNEVIESGKSTEVVENEKTEIKNKKAEELENAKRIIADYENQNVRLTNAEYKQWRINYNNANNEGGEGYIPTLITTEQYNCAKEIITS